MRAMNFWMPLVIKIGGSKLSKKQLRLALWVLL